MRTHADYEFAAGSPVGRYWLAHGVGFAVTRSDGSRLGVLEEVLVDPFGQRPEGVIVRSRGVRARRITIAADALVSVAPAARRFVVSSGPVEPAAGAIRERSLAVARRASPAATTAVGTTRVAIGRAAAASRPYLSAVLRNLCILLLVTLRVAGRSAVGAARWIRSEAPRMRPALSASARVARSLGSSGLLALREVVQVGGRGARALAIAVTTRQPRPLATRQPSRRGRSEAARRSAERTRQALRGHGAPR